MKQPTLETELALHAQGYDFVAGLDEAGRGAWAGPVVAAAVLLPLDLPDLGLVLEGVRDSKLLSPARRDVLFDLIQETAVGIGVGVMAPQVIDEVGIVPATRQAMERSVARLPVEPDYLIIDYLELANLSIPQMSTAKADSRFLSVAAASIVAKVTRDRLMSLLEITHPGYEFGRHKGYGTAIHREALARLGPTSAHRMSFSPLHQYKA